MTKTLDEWFLHTVERHPDALALEVLDRRYTYRELERASTAIAASLLRHHRRRPTRVGLLAARSLTAYAGYLAILRLGATVVPLNPAFPAERNVGIIAAARVGCVLTDEAGAAHADAVGGSQTVLRLPDTGPADPPAGTGDSGPPAAAGDLAYVIFTSGSTGRPKGVRISHHNISALVERCVDRYGAGPGARLSHTYDLTFDSSVLDLFLAWGSGAALVVPRRNELLRPSEYVNRRGITHWFSVPSAISVGHRLGDLAPGSMPGLRWSLFGGDRLTLAQARMWRAAAPNALLENVYGPTETTVICTAYRLPADTVDWPETSNGTVPIGDLFPGHEQIVVDEHHRLADEGELCVRGPQRFPGYLAAEDDVGRFVATDATGAVRPYDGQTPLLPTHWYRTGDRIRREGPHTVHLGRVDNQVKIRGYRVELGEIEAVLRRHPGVSDAVVVAAGEDAEARLVAVYTGDEVSAAELTALVRARLPVYMLPSRFHHWAEFPLSANGKIDRRSVGAAV